MADVELLLGQSVGPCRVDALIGQGGMGRVYRARHLALDRTVALKVVGLGEDGDDAAKEAARAQILTEARSAAKLEDPRIVAIYEVGESRSIVYIVMQWVDGESLEARVNRQGRLAPAEALDIVRETAMALGAAHKAGLVHRDVKPGNILLDARGGVKLTDFGIARPAGLAAADGGDASGSFHFMAPEQAFGGPPDPRSDFYALGATWYYALTGQPAYPGPPNEALFRHRDEAVPEVRLLRPEVTDRAAELIRRLMSKNVNERPADADVLLRELRSSGMLLHTESSGSPFKLLPASLRSDPPVSPVAAIAPANLSRASAPTAVREAPRASIRRLGPMLAGLGALGLCWQWRRAGSEDWAAGVICLSLLPAGLTFFDRRRAGRKWLSAAGCATALTCWGLLAFSGGTAVPALEPAILAGVGMCALGGSAFLGQWGDDRSETVWARVLGPMASACLFASALIWSSSETQAWSADFAERASAWWTAFHRSGGSWRWIGGVVFCVVWGFATKPKVQDADKDRRLNFYK